MNGIQKHQRQYLRAIFGILVVAIVGIFAWQVLNYQRNSTAPPPALSLATPTPSYLVIKELGIKLPLSAPIKDLAYTYDCTNGGGSDTANCLHFSTASIENMVSDPSLGTTCSPLNDPLGTYTVYTSLQPNPGETDNAAGTLEASVNGYYIYYHHVQYTCGETSQDEAKVISLITPLLNSVQHAQKD